MQISGLGGQLPIGRAGGMGGPAPASTPSQTSGPAFAPTDSLEISDAARAAAAAEGAPDADRVALLARVKADIDAGVYDTEEKLESAVGRMLDGLG